MDTADLLVAPPAPDRTDAVLRRVGELLCLRRCYLWRRGYHFVIGAGLTIALTPETANRYRVEACRWGQPELPSWVRADDDDRLAGLVMSLAEGVREEV